MAKKKNNTARKAVSDITGAKPEGFDAKADAGDFKKARAGPTGSADGRGKGSAVKSKAVSEAQEMFNATPANTVSQAEEKSRKVNQEFFKNMRMKMIKIPSMLLSVKKQGHSVSTGSMRAV